MPQRKCKEKHLVVKFSDNENHQSFKSITHAASPIAWTKRGVHPCFPLAGVTGSIQVKSTNSGPDGVIHACTETDV